MLPKNIQAATKIAGLWKRAFRKVKMINRIDTMAANANVEANIGRLVDHPKIRAELDRWYDASNIFERSDGDDIEYIEYANFHFRLVNAFNTLGDEYIRHFLMVLYSQSSRRE
jgi:hypothetical protein